MAVRIRMTRTGAKNDACFRVVAADSRSPRDGRCVEILGWYDPTREGVNFKLKMDRVQHWIGHGASVSDTVRTLLKRVTEDQTDVDAAPAEVVEAAVAADENE